MEVRIIVKHQVDDVLLSIILGVGLNLTRANNVISLDLGWSFAVESQAFDRVHRMGQMRKVLVQRVVIADTVEDRILKMQERKVQFILLVFLWSAVINSLLQENVCRGSFGRGLCQENRK